MIYKPKRYIDKKYRAKEPIGYCWCFTHRGYLNVKLMEEHECLEKQCKYLQKYTQHPYWGNLEREKEEKRLRKLEKKKRKEAEKLASKEKKLKD